MRIPLPEALKKVLRPTVQWLAISLPAPQQVMDVKLIAGKREFDVTLNSAVAAMRPFTIRVGLDAELKAATRQVRCPRLHLIDRQLARVVGVLQLQHRQDWEAGDAQMALFDVTSGTNYCVPWSRRHWDSWMYRRAARHARPENRIMGPAAVEQMLIFYLCPRPVFFVSVDDGQHSNLFPMDLVGPLHPERFTLALRTTSPSVETMKRARRIALGDVPGSDCQIAYQLGAHHKTQQTDWSTLPFQALRSKQFSLRIPDIALRIREVELLDFQTVGSHTLFVGRICSEQPLRTAPALFHTCGAHQRLRAALGRPFAEALRGAG